MTIKQSSCLGEGKVDDMDSNIGYRLKLRRSLLGLSQKDLADVLQIIIQQIQKYENAINRISSSRLCHLAKLLSVSMSYFCCNERFLCHCIKSNIEKDRN
jgi:transcriptional regulator with XRE-family HTH domain